jgi:hypothetical protein
VQRISIPPNKTRDSQPANVTILLHRFLFSRHARNQNQRPTTHKPQAYRLKSRASPCRSDVGVLRHAAQHKSRFSRAKHSIHDPRTSQYSDTTFVFSQRAPEVSCLKPGASCWHRVGVNQQSHCNKSQIPSRKPATTHPACWFTPTRKFNNFAAHLKPIASSPAPPT